MIAAAVFSPSPTPAAMPQASAMTFLHAPPTSAPMTSALVYGRKYPVASARCRATARPESLQATTVAAGCSSAISLARFGPVTTATRDGSAPVTWTTTWLIRINVSSSMPLARLTSVTSSPIRRAQSLEIGAQRLRRHREQHRARTGQRFGGVAGGADRLRQFDVAEVAGVAVGVVDLVGQFGTAGPQRDVVARIGQAPWPAPSPTHRPPSPPPRPRLHTLALVAAAAGRMALMSGTQDRRRRPMSGWSSPSSGSPPPRPGWRRCSPPPPGKAWCWPCWSTPSPPRSAVPALQSVTVVTPDEVAADAARQLGARVLTDPTPDGHRNPLNNAIAAAEAVDSRVRRRISLRCKVICPRCNRRNWPRRSPPPAAYPRSFVGDRHGTGTSALFAFGVALDPQFGPDSARAPSSIRGRSN